ncbi:nitroreductase [Akkermansiaceae bacterium]|nr:nitroreductase [Akkermansiaceae bacterium]
MNLPSFKELAAHRRSIKPVDMDATKEVSKELLLELAECGNWAPSHGLTEPMRLHIFQGDKRAEFATNLQAAYTAETAESEFKQAKFDSMGRNVAFSHTVIAIVMKRGDNAKVPETEEVQAVACAIQNMHLAASAAGLGLYWSSPPATRGAYFKEFLGLRECDQCLGFLFVGWPKQDFTWPESRRKPVADKITWR